MCCYTDRINVPERQGVLELIVIVGSKNAGMFSAKNLKRLWSFFITAGMAKPCLFRTGGSSDMWYVIQTVTGKEEELMLFIRTLLSREHFENCFMIRAEWLKRLGGEWQLQIRPLFPGYVFIETKEPGRLYMELKAVPKFSRLLGNSRDEFIPVKAEEEKFLRMITGATDSGWDFGDAIVQLTSVETDDDGEVVSMNGALMHFEKEIVRMNLHKRYAVVQTRMLGEERSLVFGVRLGRKEEKASN